MMQDRQPTQAEVELNLRRNAANIRALVAMGQLTDHLNDVTQLALAGDPQARHVVNQLLDAWESMRAAKNGIIAARGQQPR